MCLSAGTPAHIACSQAFSPSIFRHPSHTNIRMQRNPPDVSVYYSCPHTCPTALVVTPYIFHLFCIVIDARCHYLFCPSCTFFPLPSSRALFFPWKPLVPYLSLLPPAAVRLSTSVMSTASVGQVSVGTGKMIGFLLAICGNTLIACSLTLQKRAHNSLSDTPSTNNDYHSPEQPPPTQEHDEPLPEEPHDEEDPSSPSSPSAPTSPPPSSAHQVAPRNAFLQNPTWWMGTFLMAAGEVGNFGAFAFAPASLVAPLGAWSVVLSAILAHVFLQEHVSNRNLIGIALCVTGAFLIGAAGPDVSAAEAALDANAVTRLLLRTPFVMFMLLTLTATALLMYISHRTTLGRKYIFIYVGVSSLLGGVTVVCAKALSTFLRLTIEGNSQFGNWLPFALVLTLAAAILAQLKYLNLAMARFGNAQVIPVYYVLFTTCAMSSGVIMYREFDALTLRNIPFFLGICSTMSGVFLVSKSAKVEAKAKAAEAALKENPMPVPHLVKTDVEVDADYEPMLPGSPMSSPRGSQQPVWP